MKGLDPAVATVVALSALSSCVSPPRTDAPAEEPEIESPRVAQAPEPPAPAIRTAKIGEIDISGLFALREAGKALIYDVRLPLYYKLGHIEGAILFYPKPFDEAFGREEPRMKQALKDGKTIVLYCGGADCNDSKVVAKMFAERGIPVSVYPDGWAEWKTVGIE